MRNSGSNHKDVDNYISEGKEYVKTAVTKAREYADAGTEYAEQAISTVGGAMASVGQRVKTVGDTLTSSGDYISKIDAEKVAKDAKRAIKKYPFAALCAAAVVGLWIGRKL